MDSRFRVLTVVFVRGTWILDCNRKWDSEFLERYSGLSKQKFPGFRNPDSLTWGEVLLAFEIFLVLIYSSYSRQSTRSN